MTENYRLSVENFLGPLPFSLGQKGMRGIGLLVLVLLFLNLEARERKDSLLIHPVYHQYTSADGLPSSEVHGVLQDKNRDIWLYTSKGLSRFNGERFENYSFPRELQSNVIIQATKDHQGNLWFCTSLSEFFYYSPDRQQFQFLTLPDTFRNELSTYIIHRIQVQEDTLWFQMRQFYQGKIVLDSTYIQSVQLMGNDTAFGIQQVNEEMIFYGVRPSLFESYMKQWLGPSPLGHYSHNSVWMTLQPNPRGYLVTCGSLLLLYDESFHLLDYYQSTANFSKGMLEVDDDRVWVSTVKEGIILFDLSKGIEPQKQLLTGFQITDMLIDDEGGLWATSPDQGVCYFPDLETYELNHLFKPNHVHLGDLVSDQGEMLVAEKRTGIHRLYLDGNWRLNTLLASSASFNLTNYEASTHTLSFTSHYSSAFSYVDSSLNLKQVRGNVGFEDENKRDWHIMSRAHELLIRSKDSTYGVPLPYPIGRIANGATVSPDGLYLLGRKGICRLQYKQGQVVPVFSQWDEQTPSRFAQLIPHSEGYLVASEGSGLMYLQNDTLRKLLPATGSFALDYCTSLIEVPDQPDQFFVGTDKGLYRVQRKNTSYQVIQHYAPTTGFPFRHILKLGIVDDHLLVAGENQSHLISLNRLQSGLGSDKLSIDSLLSNGLRLHPDADQGYHLRPDQSIFTIHYHNQTFRNALHHRYRYRIASLTPQWTLTEVPQVVLSGLAPGSHRFELESMGINGRWGPVKSLDFVVHPPLYLEPWFLGLTGLIILLLSTLAVWWRFRLLQWQTRQRSAVIIAQNKSMGAHLNPHFLYNVLNTVGSSLVQNSSDHALDTLGHFSRLIRKVFAHSQREQISLEEELDSLTAYVDLEKRRLKEKFSFHTLLDDHLESEKLFLPPLLLQPIVENAIWHGMSKSQGTSEVELKITLNNDLLVIDVSDNGPGFEWTDANEIQPQVRSGLQIIVERIRLLNQLNGNLLSLEFMEKVNGPYHTTVRLTLPNKLNMK